MNNSELLKNIDSLTTANATLVTSNATLTSTADNFASTVEENIELKETSKKQEATINSLNDSIQEKDSTISQLNDTIKEKDQKIEQLEDEVANGGGSGGNSNIPDVMVVGDNVEDIWNKEENFTNYFTYNYLKYFLDGKTIVFRNYNSHAYDMMEVVYDDHCNFIRGVFDDVSFKIKTESFNPYVQIERSYSRLFEGSSGATSGAVIINNNCNIDIDYTGVTDVNMMFYNTQFQDQATFDKMIAPIINLGKFKSIGDVFGSCKVGNGTKQTRYYNVPKYPVFKFENEDGSKINTIKYSPIFDLTQVLYNQTNFDNFNKTLENYFNNVTGCYFNFMNGSTNPGNVGNMGTRSNPLVVDMGDYLPASVPEETWYQVSLCSTLIPSKRVYLKANIPINLFSPEYYKDSYCLFNSNGLNTSSYCPIITSLTFFIHKIDREDAFQYSAGREYTLNCDWANNSINEFLLSLPDINYTGKNFTIVLGRDLEAAFGNKRYAWLTETEVSEEALEHATNMGWIINNNTTYVGLIPTAKYNSYG